MVQKAKLKPGQNFLTHDNGKRPFLVNHYRNIVSVYKQPKDKIYWDDVPKMFNQYHTSQPFLSVRDGIMKLFYTQLVKKIPVSRVFIGKDPEAEEWGDGNSILLTLPTSTQQQKYVFIGHIIYEFTVEDKITHYFSHIGNNNVPYPVAVGEKYVYFMLDLKYAPRHKVKNIFDGYREYYDKKLTTSDFENVKYINFGK